MVSYSIFFHIGGDVMLQNFDKMAETYNNIESDNLKILYYDLDKGYSGTYQSYNYPRLCTILSGKKKVSINGKESITYSSSEYILLPPESSVEMTIESHTKAIVYEINNHLIDNISEKMEKSFNIQNNINKQQYSNNLLNTVKNLTSNIYQNNKESKFLMDLHAQELVYRLMQDYTKKPIYTADDNYYNPAEIAKDIISKPGNENLNINEIAQMLKMSQSNLDYYFKKEYGITPKRYQNQIKIERARYLLKKNNVTEVAMILGFENISHFIRLFKSRYGSTPKQYIRK
jgi:AraC-like DNA-binding protein